MNATILKSLYLLPLSGGDDGNENDSDKRQDQMENKVEGKKEEKGKSDDDHDEDDHDEDDLAGIADPNQRRIAELSREAARHRREKNRVRKELEKTLAEIQAAKINGGTEKEQTEALLKAEQEKNEKLLANMSNIVLRNAITEHEKYSWYDVPMVLGLINRKEVEIDLEDSVVDGLEAELKRIAKEKPYLVKKSSSGTNKDENGSSGTGTSGSTGNNPSSKNMSNDAKAAQWAHLRKEYPALNIQ